MSQPKTLKRLVVNLEISSWELGTIFPSYILFFFFLFGVLLIMSMNITHMLTVLDWNINHIKSHSVTEALVRVCCKPFPSMLLSLAFYPGFSMLAGISCLVQKNMVTKLWHVGRKASGVSLASWPTSPSTFMRTKIDSIFHPSQCNKNVNKEQKFPVLHVSEGLFGNTAFLKLILQQAWPWPFRCTPFSKATVRGSAP